MTTTQGCGASLLQGILADPTQPFAMIWRPGHGSDCVDLLVGEFVELTELADIAVSVRDSDLVVLVPYRQIVERGFACNDDGVPLLAMAVRERGVLSPGAVAEAIGPDMIGPDSIGAANFQFDVSDEEYGRIVSEVISKEIGTGEGSNFVISRSLTGSFGRDHSRTSLGLFRRLLASERSAYWTYLVHTGTQTLVGASPEAHAHLDDSVVSMNPISGTYRYPPDGATEAGLLDFLGNQKENDELFMVVDEELKMMSALCDTGATVTGPYLKEMAHLAHTEYLLSGRTDLDVADVLRETMFAPTVVGSPLESATHVVARYESVGRGYYSGAIALVDRDDKASVRMDSAILIRTAVVDEHGDARISVGSTLVRDSDPVGETHETHAKAAGLLGGVMSTTGVTLASEPAVQSALSQRNAIASPFWFADSVSRRMGMSTPQTQGSIVLIDAADKFTAMLATMLRSLGYDVTTVRYDAEIDYRRYDLVILGPGPGDPESVRDERIVAMRQRAEELVATDLPFLAVCLSHQIMCIALGLRIDRLDRPNQGLSREISLFGEQVRAGFYNTFVARSAVDTFGSVLGDIHVSRDESTGEVYALRGDRFASMQFHAESVLSKDGPAVLLSEIGSLLRRTGTRRDGAHTEESVASYG